MKAALKKGVEDGTLIQVKASYKLSPEAKKAAPKKKPAATAAKKKPAEKKKATTAKSTTKKKVSQGQCFPAACKATPVSLLLVLSRRTDDHH